MLGPEVSWVSILRLGWDAKRAGDHQQEDLPGTLASAMQKRRRRGSKMPILFGKKMHSFRTVPGTPKYSNHFLPTFRPLRQS